MVGPYDPRDGGAVVRRPKRGPCTRTRTEFVRVAQEVKMIRFVLVTGRVPRSESYCFFCGEEIQQTYIRELQTDRLYCDAACYVGHAKMLMLAVDRGTRQASRSDAHSAAGRVV